MQHVTRTASLALATGAACVSIAGQSMLMDVMIRHGVPVPGGSYERAFDAGMRPSMPVNPGSFATPLGLMTSATGGDRIDAAFAFGILAGRSGLAASPQELAAAGQSLVVMIGADDRRTRIAGARVAGRLFAAPWGPDAPWPVRPAGLREALFALLNQDSEIDQLAAMDALGFIRETSAVTSLVERYRFYRTRNKRALAGGALEAVARIGIESSVPLVKELAGDRWADGRDATALAVLFARERLLHDGSIALIQQALDDKSRHTQARGYLIELGALVP
jgi:hypothetical protein